MMRPEISSASNPVSVHLRQVAQRYAILSMILVAVFAFGARSVWPLVGAVPAFAAAFALLPVFALIGFGWSLRLLVSPLEHPSLRALERAAPGARKRLLHAFQQSDFLIARGPLLVSREAAALLLPWGFEARFMDDLAWLHPTVLTVSAGFTMRSHLLITLRFRKAKDLELGVSAKELEDLTQMLTRSWPRVVVGWSEAREKLWHRDRERFGTHHTT